MPERGYLIFLLFFSEFSCPGREWTEFGTKFFFFVVLSLSHPVLAKNNVGKGFLKILNFFAIFFGIFLSGSNTNGIRDKNFFLSFSASFNSFWIEIIPELTFLIFWIFLPFFLEFSISVWVWTEFGTKIFFSLFRPISPRFG